MITHDRRSIVKTPRWVREREHDGLVIAVALAGGGGANTGRKSAHLGTSACSQNLPYDDRVTRQVCLALAAYVRTTSMRVAAKCRCACLSPE